MTFLDLFALFVLLTLLLTILGLWIALGMMPGRIARQRNHPQADAINMCGWWGALTLGLLTPLAFIWAYSNPRWRIAETSAQSAQGADAK